MQKLVIADLDGTLTPKDTLLEFIRFTHGSLRLYLGFLLNLPFVLLYWLKLYSSENFKKRMLKHFFNKWHMEELKGAGEKFAVENLPLLMFKEAQQKLQFHKKRGDKIIILTASCAFWIKAWTEKEGYELIATEIDEDAKCFDGKFITPNCKGKEKVNRLQQNINLADYNEIIAYGNEKADLYFMQLAHFKHFRPFS